MHLPQKIVGIEQVGDEQINHTKMDTRPVLGFTFIFILTIAVLIVTEVTK
jgi:hypothetical protein